MKHCAPEKLAEFARGSLPVTQREAVQQHLYSCSTCVQLADLYRRVISVGSREASYAPPRDAVRTVKTSFGTDTAAIGHSTIGSQLIFDSWVQPATAGARAASLVPTRQLLYRVGPTYLDVKIDKEFSLGRASLLGQMLEGSEAGRPIAGVQVVLVNRGRSIARTSSNKNGEFQFEFAMRKDLALALAIDREKPVYLPTMGIPIKRTTVRRGRRRKANGGTAKAP